MTGPAAQAFDLRNLGDRCPIDLGRSAGVVITQEMVDTHTATTGDAQWIHNDPERARRDSPFGGPIVQGFLLLATLTRLSTDLSFPDLGSVALMVNYGFDRVRFVHPVPVGAAVALHGTLSDVRPRDDGSAVLSVDVELWAEHPEPSGVTASPDPVLPVAPQGHDVHHAPAVVARWLFLAVPA